MSFLKNAIESVDPQPDKTKELTLALNLLYELAEQKSILFKKDLIENLRTAGTPENPTIPITSVLAWHQETRAYVKKSPKELVKTVENAIGKFIDGGSEQIISGIGDLVSRGLEGILGSGVGIQAEMHAYYIVVEALSIVRFDISAWSRRIEAKGITSNIQNALAFQTVKSSVDVDAITFNTFLQAYKSQLNKLNLPPDKLKAFIIESKEVFELLRDPGSKKVKQTSLLQFHPSEIKILQDGVVSNDIHISRT